MKQSSFWFQQASPAAGNQGVYQEVERNSGWVSILFGANYIEETKLKYTQITNNK